MKVSWEIVMGNYMTQPHVVYYLDNGTVQANAKAVPVKAPVAEEVVDVEGGEEEVNTSVEEEDHEDLVSKVEEEDMDALLGKFVPPP